MQITSFEFSDPDSPQGWALSKVTFNSRLNLFVGASGSGKTRVLNMLVNIASAVLSDNKQCTGEWTWAFRHKGKHYNWNYHGKLTDEKQVKVIKERLSIISEDGQEEILFDRSENRLTVLNKEAPKLSTRNPAIYLLREEERIAPVYDAFRNILRRNFNGSDLVDAAGYQSMPAALIRTLDKKKSIEAYWEYQYTHPLSLAVRLSTLQKYFPNLYETINDQFRRVFPFVLSMTIGKASDTMELPVTGDIPVLMFLEKGVRAPTPLQEMSSGMQKVLLIISDVVTAPKEALYLIDEYENSLGINAIDFFPSFLDECGGERQFILTSHHPALINAISVGDWFVFHRAGTKILVKHGKELEDKYGKSRQQKFIQLLNDPFYAEGVE